MNQSIKTCFIALAFAALIGCRGETLQDTSVEPWSTKSASVFEPGQVQLSPPGQPVVPTDVYGMREAAIDLLVEAVQSSDPLLRANAVEGLQRAPDRLGPLLPELFVDDNRGVRFVATMTVGKLGLVEMASLVEPLRYDESQSVQAAAIFALRRCGYQTDPTRLSIFLKSDDPEVRANTALILGELGNPSAIPMLRAAARAPMTRVSSARARIVELQIAEAMVKLGAEEELNVVRAALFNPTNEHGEIKALAALAIGRLGDTVYTATLFDMATREGDRREPAEVRMAAAFALAQFDPRSAPVEIALEFTQSEQPELRAQAALTLGQGDNPDHRPTVAMMMSDPNALVQVSAASAALQMATS